MRWRHGGASRGMWRVNVVPPLIDDIRTGRTTRATPPLTNELRRDSTTNTTTATILGLSMEFLLTSVAGGGSGASGGKGGLTTSVVPGSSRCVRAVPSLARAVRLLTLAFDFTTTTQPKNKLIESEPCGL